MCSWGVCHAAQYVVLRAAGESSVCSAGPAGCFYKRGDSLLHNARTYAHMQAQTHRCLQALVLTAQVYVVTVTMRHCAICSVCSRSVSVQRQGLSCSLCLMSASWQPVSYTFSSLLSVCQKACSKMWKFGLPRQASEGPPLTRFPQAEAGGGGGLTLAASFT